MYKQYGKFDVGKLKKITTMEAVMKYHVWEQEACLKICEETSIEKGTWSYEGFIIFFVFHWFMLPYFLLFIYRNIFSTTYVFLYPFVVWLIPGLDCYY